VSSTTLDQPFKEARLAAEPAFEPSHAAVIVLVIIAKKVQKPMQGEDAQLGGQGMPGFPGLAPRNSHRDHDIAQLPGFFRGE
jgi:hypothetical protein